jgi:diadenosine tetraphosphatase ApaH/serine/threonine PP2A family protein phosphatase
MKNMDVNYILQNETCIQDGTRYLINVGSVGQPRDGNPYACYCVYDTSSRLLQLKRIPYDIHKAQEKILNAGLPHIFADRLPQGR